METINYFVRATELMLLLSVVYLVFLRSNTLYQVKRFYLLLAGLASWLLPLLYDTSIEGMRDPVTYLQVVYLDAPAIFMTTPAPGGEWNPADYLMVIYFAGLIVAALFLCYRFFRLYLVLRKAHYSGNENTWYLPNRYASCSFLGKIYLPITVAEEEKEMIIRHERVHVRQFHSIDLLFYELLCVIFWFNPLYRLAKRELMATHEFIADREAGGNNEVDYARLLVARALGVPMNTIHSFSSQIFLKRRLFMLNKEKSPRKSIVLYLLALPLMAATFFVQSFTFATRQSAPPASEVSAAVPGTDKVAEFIGGNEALSKYLSDHLKYPADAKAKNIEGKVFVEFTVDQNGKVKNVNTKKGVHQSLDAEAVRLISSMPDWNPGEKEGKKVSSTLILPIVFKIGSK